MANNITNIRIFLSSPSGLTIERNTVARAAQELNKMLSSAFNRQLQIIGWEDVNPAISTYAQQVINEQLNDYDVFLGILGVRFGTPTPNAGSGTEEEFDIAYKKYQKNEIREICLFFKEDGFTIQDIDVEQIKKLTIFKEKVSKLGCYRSDFKEAEFENNIRKLFISFLTDWDKYSSKKNSTQLINEENQFLIDIDQDIGYFDAIYAATEELNKGNEITVIFSKAANLFNNSMLDTTKDLQKCISDQERTRIINDFSEVLDIFANTLSINMNKQMSFIINSMNYFNIGAKIYYEDFTDNFTEIEIVIISLKSYLETVENNVPVMQKIIFSINQLPRATTKLNKSKAQLIHVLNNFIKHQKQVIEILNTTLDNVKNLK